MPTTCTVHARKVCFSKIKNKIFIELYSKDMEKLAILKDIKKIILKNNLSIN